MALFANSSRLQWQIESGILRISGNGKSERWILVATTTVFGGMLVAGFTDGRLTLTSPVAWIFASLCCLCLAALFYNAATVVEIDPAARRVVMMRTTLLGTSTDTFGFDSIRRFHSVKVPDEGRDHWQIVIERAGHPTIILHDILSAEGASARAAANAANRLIGLPLDGNSEVKLGLRLGVTGRLYVAS